MKYFLGILVTLIILAGGTLVVLAIWGIYPVSWALIIKTLLTILGVAIIVTLLIVFSTPFFKKDKYEKTGNKAHPMSNKK